MKSFKEFLNESVTLTGTLVHTGLLEGYVKLFYKMLSTSTKSYKKQPKSCLYIINGCGEVFDENTTTKIVDKRPSYRLTSQIVTNYGRVHYILDMDVDSSNCVSMYRDYADRSNTEKYNAVMTAKKNIIEALKNAGFSVRSDRASIYASIPDYVKNPTSENGLIGMNAHQRALLRFVKKLFTFDGVTPASNMYGLSLRQAKLKNDISDENGLNTILAGNSFAKVCVYTNGKIEFFRFENDEIAESTLLGCFEPIQKDDEE